MRASERTCRLLEMVPEGCGGEASTVTRRAGRARLTEMMKKIPTRLLCNEVSIENLALLPWRRALLYLLL